MSFCNDLGSSQGSKRWWNLKLQLALVGPDLVGISSLHALKDERIAKNPIAFGRNFSSQTGPCLLSREESEAHLDTIFPTDSIDAS